MPEWDALRQGAQQVVRGTPRVDVDRADLPEGAAFLRVTSGGNTAMLALERIEAHPDGRILVWTSGLGEVLRVQEGRLISATGLRTEWRHVVLPKMPDWPQIAAMQKPLQWVRVRDVMPGYRFEVRDELSVRAIPAPEKSALRVLDPKTLSWFEERLANRPPSSDLMLPPARYAVRMNTETVVYAEQCLARDLCLVWQRWTAELQRANREQLAQGVSQ